MQICSACKEELPYDAFFVRNTLKQIRHRQCKKCYRVQRLMSYPSHYRAQQKRYRMSAITTQARIRQIFRDNMMEYLKDKSCGMCGENDMRVLEFDHLDPTAKTFSISQAVRLNKRWHEVLVEMNKCQLLCANCHKKRTAQQFNWYKNK